MAFTDLELSCPRGIVEENRVWRLAIRARSLHLRYALDHRVPRAASAAPRDNPDDAAGAVRQLQRRFNCEAGPEQHNEGAQERAANEEEDNAVDAVITEGSRKARDMGDAGRQRYVPYVRAAVECFRGLLVNAYLHDAVAVQIAGTRAAGLAATQAYVVVGLAYADGRTRSHWISGGKTEQRGSESEAPLEKRHNDPPPLRPAPREIEEAMWWWGRRDGEEKKEGEKVINSSIVA